MQTLTEISEMHDFKELINIKNEVYLIQIEYCRGRIIKSFQTYSDTLKMFEEK